MAATIKKAVPTEGQRARAARGGGWRWLGGAGAGGYSYHTMHGHSRKAIGGGGGGLGEGVICVIGIPESDVRRVASSAAAGDSLAGRRLS